MGKYNEIMGRLELSAEARERILDRAAESAAAEETPRGTVIPISIIRRYAAVAACLAVVLLAVFALPELRKDREETPGLAVSSVTEYSDAEELAASIGFPVEELTALPFEAEETVYSNFFGKFAQLVYSGGDASVTYRKGYGDDDISGDYNAYEDVWERQLGDAAVTLKGGGSTVRLAVWQRDGFSYALSFDPGISEGEALSILEPLLFR